MNMSPVSPKEMENLFYEYSMRKGLNIQQNLKLYSKLTFQTSKNDEEQRRKIMSNVVDQNLT